MTAVKYLPRKIPANECQCKVCGKTFYGFPSANRQTCGKKCNAAITSSRFRTHGQSGTRLYNIWHDMRSRCKGTGGAMTRGYYHDRGIEACEAWGSFPPFQAWALENGYRDDLELDRIDVDGNYEPSNCRWATRSQQMRNTRKRRQKNRTSKYRGVSRCQTSAVNPWRAQIFLSGKPFHIGVFPTEEKAAEAYNAAALVHFKEFANLNQIPEGSQSS